MAWCAALPQRPAAARPANALAHCAALSSAPRHVDARRAALTELVAALATALSGSLSERLRAVFDAFNDGSGQLGLAQLIDLASTLFRLKLYDPTAAAALS